MSGLQWLSNIPVCLYTLSNGSSCKKSKITRLYHPSSLCRCEHRQLKLLLWSLPGRRLFRRRWWRRGLLRRRRVWKRKWRRRRQQLHGELGVKGQVQLVRRCQEIAGQWLVRRPVARFPGEEDLNQPLRRLWWWDPVNKVKFGEKKAAVHEGAVNISAAIVFSCRQFQWQFLSRVYTQRLWDLLWVRLMTVLEYAPYFSSFILYICVFFPFFLFSFSGSGATRGRSESRGMHWCSFICSSSHFIISASSASESSWLSLLNQDSFVHCVIFFPESEIRARLQSASPTACRCKTTWDTLIRSLSVMQSTHKATKHLYESLLIQRSTQIFGLELCCCQMLSARYISHTRRCPLLHFSHECLPPWNFN